MIWGIFKKTQKEEQTSERIEAEKKVKEMMKADKVTPEFKTKKEENEIEKMKSRVWGEKFYREEKMFEKQAERNLTGIELEKAGKVDEAIELFEKNVEENFIGSHPYYRLAIIYRKRGQIDEEIRVLEKAISVFKKDDKQEQFKTRLGKIYNKLAMSYHQDEQYDDEVEILEKALKVFKGDKFFKRRLEKAKALKESKN
jgi:tetratricopeptide (TPR) repeat protein